MADEKSKKTNAKCADPFGAFRVAAEPWDGLDAVLDEVCRYQQRGFAQTEAVFEEVVRLTNSTLSLTKQIAEQWLGVARDGTRQARGWFESAA